MLFTKPFTGSYSKLDQVKQKYVPYKHVQTSYNYFYPMTKTKFMQKMGVQKCMISAWLP